MTFNTKPIFIISFCGTNPDANAIAFGGVPAGSIKPYDAAIVAGSTNIIGLICNWVDNVKSSGKINAALAVLLINSVITILKMTIIHKKRNKGTTAINFTT